MKAFFYSPIFGLVGCSLFWALNAIIAREFRNISEPFDLNFFRWLFALIIFTPFAYQSVLKDSQVIKANLIRLVILSTLSVAFFNSFQYMGGVTTSAINLGLINSMNPIVTLILAWPILKQKPTFLMLFGILISFLGVSLVILKEGFFQFNWLNFNEGDLWMFAAVVGWTIYSILMKKWSISISLISFLWVTIFFGVFITLIAKSIYYFDVSLIIPQFHSELIWVYLFVAIFPSILAYLFWNRGVKAYGPTVSALFIYTSPCFIAVISFFLLNRELTQYHLYGGLMIFAGFCSVFFKKEEARRLRQFLKF